MENKREISKLFKDKLDLLDKSPSDKLWTSIESDLNKKRKRRILLWLIPTLLIVGLGSSILLFESKNYKSNLLDSRMNKSVVIQSDQINKGSTAIPNKQSKDTVNSISKNKRSANKTVSNKTITLIQKSRTEKLIRQSSRLVTITDDYEEYEVVKRYKVVIRKNRTTTTFQKSNVVFKKSGATFRRSNAKAEKSKSISKKNNSKTIKKHPENNDIKKYNKRYPNFS